MGWGAVDVGGHDIRLDLVGFGFPVAAMGGRIDHVEQPPGPGAVAKLGEGHAGPYGRMGVLAAVFAHARHIALDVAGVQRTFVEGRIEQQYRSDVGSYQVFLD
ncbi:hypothetical protein D3C87_1853480 [compost metagenome]